jgi:hypothetical protein
MTITNDLFLAILAMDSYNRGYNAGLVVPGTQIGSATLGRGTNADTEPNAVTASFFAQSYSWNGQTVISYRGTDAFGDVPAWGTFLNNPIFATQHRLAATFYQFHSSSPLVGWVLGRPCGRNPTTTERRDMSGAVLRS